MNVDVYSQEGKKTGKVNLKDSIFGVEPNEDLMAQYIRVYRFNQRRGTRKTKTRAEVSGGGRKPWRQKGTGRARHGSIRSPIWVGGGTAHGPKTKNVTLRITKKMKRKALFCALSQRLLEEGILVLSDLKLNEIKTKQLNNVLSKLPIKGKDVLIALPVLDKNIILSARNLPKVKTIQANQLNAYEVIRHETVILPKDSVGIIEKAFLQKDFRGGGERPISIVDPGMSRRTLNALQKAGIKTVDELRKLSAEEIKNIKGLGDKSVEEINEKTKNQREKSKTTSLPKTATGGRTD